MNTENRLLAAIESGEILTVAYEGGSQPGSIREIAPTSISENKVRALCVGSDTFKYFHIDKISVIERPQQDMTQWLFGIDPSPCYKSINDLLGQKREFLSELGWHIESDEEYFSLHRYFKNGKPRKGADVLLCFEEFDFSVGFDEQGNFIEEKMGKRQRPWVLRADDQITRTFGSLDKAATAFLKTAEKLAPNRAIE